MKVYIATKASEISNTVVEDINAAVLTATFKSTEGVQKATLCRMEYGVGKVIARGTCEPVHTAQTENILLVFN